MSERQPISTYLTNNTIRTYYALDEAMSKAHHDPEDTEENNLFAESTARTLLSNADLPLLIRARACMILGCSLEDDYLEMAKEAVRIAELVHEDTDGPEDRETILLNSCREVLKEAQQAHDDNAKEMEEQEKDEVIVWEAPPFTEAQPAAPLTVAQQAKKIRQKPQGRVDSGQGGPPPPPRWEELDEATGKWTERGPPREGENVEVVKK